MSIIRIHQIWDRLSTSYWFIPAVSLVIGIILARVMLGIDARVPNSLAFPLFLFTGTASDARVVLISLAGTILGTASVVYSLLTVPLSVAASQFGSRLIRLYLRDHTTQIILGMFVGTFVYLVSVALGIPSAVVTPETPQIAASLGFLLCLLTFGSIIVLIHHIGTTLQAPNMVASASGDLAGAIEAFLEADKLRSELDPTKGGNPSSAQVLQEGSAVYSTHKGYIQYIDPGSVIPLAEENDLAIYIAKKPGHFIEPGDIIAYIFPPDKFNQDLADQIRDAYDLGNQRTPSQDLIYAINQLVEVALRAMSPAINDPFTAMTCLDHIGAGLASFGGHTSLKTPCYYNESGRLRLLFNPLSFGELMDSALNMLRRVSRENTEVLLAILKAIETISSRTTIAEYRLELAHQVMLVEAESQASIALEWDKERIRRRCRELISTLEATPGNPIHNPSK